MSTTTAPSASESFLARLLARFRRSGGPPSSSPSGERRWPRITGYVSFFFLSFVFFAYMTFPYDRVRDFLVHQVELAIPGAELEIVSIEPAWLTGIEAQGVRLRLPAEPEPPRPAGVAAGAGPRRPSRPSVNIPYLYARASILPYLLGTTEVVFEIETDGGGTIEGYVTNEETVSHVTAHLESVDLRRIGVLRHYLGFSLGGQVSGDIDLTVADEIEGTDGTITLNIAEATIGDEQFEVPLPVPGLTALQLSRVSIGDLALELPVEDGVGRVQRLAADGSHVVLRGTGSVRIHRSFRMTSLDLLVRAAIQPAYTEANPAVGGALALAGSNPMVAPYRAPDGAFQVRLQGTLGSRVTALAAGSATIPQ